MSDTHETEPTPETEPVPETGPEHEGGPEHQGGPEHEDDTAAEPDALAAAMQRLDEADPGDTDEVLAAGTQAHEELQNRLRDSESS